MTSLSGGLVYEYSQEEADYGLVVLNSNGSVSLREDFDNLQKQYNKLNIGLIESASSQATQVKAPSCSDKLITAKEFSKNFTIPAVCPGCQDLIDNGIKDPKNGKLVDVTDTKPKQEFFGSNGAQIKNLELKKLANDATNTPGGENTSPSGTGNGNAAKPSSTGKPNAAGQLASSVWVWASVFVGAMLL